MNRAQRLDEKNRVICLVIMFTPRITVWANFLSASERFYLALLENAIDYWVFSSHLQDIIP